MSDMTFKQAKDLIEKIELTELGLRKTIKYIDISTLKFHQALKAQEDILKRIPNSTSQVNILKIVVAFNVGLGLGMVIGKFL
jgi:hypothetical protein